MLVFGLIIAKQTCFFDALIPCATTTSRLLTNRSAPLSLWPWKSSTLSCALTVDKMTHALWTWSLWWEHWPTWKTTKICNREEMRCRNSFVVFCLIHRITNSSDDIMHSDFFLAYGLPCAIRWDFMHKIIRWNWFWAIGTKPHETWHYISLYFSVAWLGSLCKAL